MEILRPTLQHRLTRDYLQSVNYLVGKKRSCEQISTTMAIVCVILSGISSALAFSGGYFGTPYVSYAAGCAGVLTMVCLKLSYFSRSQSSYYNDELRYHLTTDYQFLNNFFTNPLAIQPISQPVLPDPSISVILPGEKLTKEKPEPKSETKPEPETKPESKSETRSDYPNEIRLELGTEIIPRNDT